MPHKGAGRCSGGMGCVRVSGWRSLLVGGKAGRRGIYLRKKTGGRERDDLIPSKKETSTFWAFVLPMSQITASRLADAETEQDQQLLE